MSTTFGSQISPTQIEKKIRMVSGMYDFVLQLKKHQFKKKHPTASDREIMELVIKEFHGVSTNKIPD